jgi:hypothetical protein
MARKQAPLKVDIPRPADERPAWSKVGIVGVAGFILGVAWPRVAGVKVGPGVPGDHKTAETAAPEQSGPRPTGGAASAAAPSAAGSAVAANQELVVVDPGKIVKCRDKKDTKIDDCEKLQFDPTALPRLKALASCPSAMGLEGKLPLSFEVDFEKKEVHVTKGKKPGVPASTVQGILQCAAREFSSIALDEIPHKYRRYTLSYTITFYPPGKHPEEQPAEKPSDDGSEEAAGATTNESGATGTATVAWDTALVRKDPKDGDVVARLVRGTKVKLVGKQNDWYRVETGAKTGWVYRGAIGL